MNDYTIRCSAEQTRKAIELGAPIEQVFYNVVVKESLKRYGLVMIGGKEYKIPTAEEMIGWLEEQGILIDIHFYCVSWDMGVRTETGHIVSQRLRIESRKEATLAAIDDALEYLNKQK